MTLIGGVRIELECCPDFGRRAELANVESRTYDSDDDVRISTERNLFPDDVRIACKAPRPQAVADEGDLFAVRQIFFARERASFNNRSAEEIEVIRGHLRRLELFGNFTTRVIDDSGPERRSIFNRRLTAPVLEFRRRGCRALSAGEGVHEHH